MKCNKLIFVKILNRHLPCVGKKHHQGKHTADLRHQIFGRITVLRLGRPDMAGRTYWIVRRDNKIYSIQAATLLNGTNSGKYSLSGFSQTPEYRTVRSHKNAIFSGRERDKAYKNIPFYDDWNPSKGGSYAIGYRWIIENLGKRPDKNWSLDIIEHEKGFVPGNLRWAQRLQQKKKPTL